MTYIHIIVAYIYANGTYFVHPYDMSTKDVTCGGRWLNRGELRTGRH